MKNTDKFCTECGASQNVSQNAAQNFTQNAEPVNSIFNSEKPKFSMVKIILYLLTIYFAIYIFRAVFLSMF